MKTENELMIFFKENERAVVMFYDSIDDYISTRFLMNNGFLREGLIFGCYAIEKIIKSFMLLKGKIPSNIHNLLYLKKILNVDTQYIPDTFDTFLLILYNHFQDRYMANGYNLTKSSMELNEIDTIYLYLLKELPLIPEIKFRSRFFQYLFSSYAQDNYAEALKMNNDLLNKELPEFKIKWEEYR